MCKALLWLIFQEWFTVLEHYHRLNCTVSDLIMGNSYSFRVFTENRCGLSENAAVTKDLAYIQKTGERTPSSVFELSTTINCYTKVFTPKGNATTE